MNEQGSWVEFREEPSAGKTKRYGIYSREQNSLLGYIRWYSPFRRYAFYTEPDCFFEQDCLGDILSFIKKLDLQHKAQKQQDKQSQI